MKGKKVYLFHTKKEGNFFRGQQNEKITILKIEMFPDKNDTLLRFGQTPLISPALYKSNS